MARILQCLNQGIAWTGPSIQIVRDTCRRCATKSMSPSRKVVCGERLQVDVAVRRLSKLAETEVREFLLVPLRLLLLQAAYQPKASYLSDVQVDSMTEFWRRKITFWFEQIGGSFGLHSETLSTAVNLLDRYLSVESVDSRRFQLASLGALFIAVKTQETQPIKMADLVSLSSDAFTAADLASIELDIMTRLKWKLHPPTFHTFVNLLLVLLEDSVDVAGVEAYALHFAEPTRLHAEFIKYPPSLIAVSSILCALKSLAAENTVHKWLSRVQSCRLSYASLPDASALVFECGTKLIDLDRERMALLNVAACDAEVESATSRSTPVVEMSEAGREQSSTPTDVTEIDAIQAASFLYTKRPSYDD